MEISSLNTFLRCGIMENSEISEIRVRKIMDSRGGFTVEVIVESEDISSNAMVANSTSTGSHEVCAFPNGDVDACISNFETKKKDFIGIDAIEQKAVDDTLKSVGGEGFGFIGGNIATGVSIAAAKLAAKSLGMELYEYVHAKFTKQYGIRKSIPRPLGNLIGGGAHSNNKMSIQEILISADSGKFMKNATINAQAHKELGKRLKSMGMSTGVNIEGAWNTGLGDMENLKLAKSVAMDVGKETGSRIELGADFAASEFFKEGRYRYSDASFDVNGHVEFVYGLIRDFSLSYVEDPMNEDDFGGFASLLKKSGKSCMIVGDDLYTTNKSRVEEGIKKLATNGVLIKVNQIGTLSDTLDVIKVSHENGLATIVSHRSRETTDNFIAHLAVAFGSKFIKTGIVGGERVSKLNEVARIEEIESLVG